MELIKRRNSEHDGYTDHWDTPRVINGMRVFSVETKICPEGDNFIWTNISLGETFRGIFDNFFTLFLARGNAQLSATSLREISFGEIIAALSLDTRGLFFYFISFVSLFASENAVYMFLRNS